MLSFFSGLLGFNTAQESTPGPSVSEHARLARVSEEMARLEREEFPRAPPSPSRTAKRKAVEMAATPVPPVAPKLRKLVIEKALAPISDMENTPTAEICSRRGEGECVLGVPTKRKRDADEPHDDVAERLTPPMKKASVATKKAEDKDAFPHLGEKRKATEDMEGAPLSSKKATTAHNAIESGDASKSSSKRKASDMESHENGDRVRLEPAIKVTHSDSGAKAVPITKADATPRHAPGTTPSSKSKKSPAYYRSLAKACRSKRLQFSVI